MNTKAFFPCGGGSNLILGTGMENQNLSTEWVDCVEEPMKYQALRPHFFPVVGAWCANGCGWWGGGRGLGWGWSNLIYGQV